jgi:hypothetical protein
VDSPVRIEVRRRAAAHQQADGLDEHRFARPGFAGQDVETRLEFDLDRIDDGEVLNAQRNEASLDEELQCYHMFDSRLGAWYSDDSALSQRRIIARRLVCARSETCSLCRSKAPLLQELRSVVAFLDLIKDSSPISQFVLVVLVIFSIVSWGIILYKLWTFNRIQAQSSRFLEIFRRSTKFSEVQAVCQSLERQSARGNFSRRLCRAESATSPVRRRCRILPTPAAAPRPVLKSLVSVDVAPDARVDVEDQKLEKTHHRFCHDGRP